MTKCGYVALLGRPNAGKSTLLNAVLKAKVSVVSAKPQTTRNRILGVHTEGETQLLFLDTPGMHHAEGMPRIHRAMNKAAWGVIADANVVCYLVDSDRGWHEEDAKYLSGVLERAKVPVCVLATKVDKNKKEIVEERMDVIAAGVEEILKSESLAEARERICRPFPYAISSKRPEELEAFRAFLSEKMPESPWLYAEDDLTDRPQQFICGEIIREQVFRQLAQELPYSCGVRVDKFEDQGTLVRMHATIVVQKESHKGMVIGRGGSRLKSIGTEARLNLERHLDKKVFLELFVKVHENWLNEESLIAEYASLSRDGE